MLTLEAQLGNIVDLDFLIELAEFPRAVVVHVAGVDEVVDVEFWGRAVHGVWRDCGVETVGGAGGGGGAGGEEGGEEGEDEEEDEGEELLEDGPGGGDGIWFGIAWPSSRSGASELVDAEAGAAAHVEDELGAAYVVYCQHFFLEDTYNQVELICDSTKWTKPTSTHTTESTTEETVKQFLWRNLLFEHGPARSRESTPKATESAAAKRRLRWSSAGVESTIRVSSKLVISRLFIRI